MANQIYKLYNDEILWNILSCGKLNFYVDTINPIAQGYEEGVHLKGVGRNLPASYFPHQMHHE